MHIDSENYYSLITFVWNWKFFDLFVGIQNFQSKVTKLNMIDISMII